MLYSIAKNAIFIYVINALIIIQNYFQKYDIGNDNIEIVFCKEANHHKEELKFFCKNHNELCCPLCITKIKVGEYGQHCDCDICLLEKIEDEKLNNLKENVNYLREVSKAIEKSMEELKTISIKIDENKEKIKINISQLFTKLRNAINEREDQLLSEVDITFNELIFDEKLIKQNAKLPIKIKEFLEIGEKVENEWKNNKNKLNIYINESIIIEKNIKNIKKIQQSIEKFKAKNIEVIFLPEEEKKIKKIISLIMNYGKLALDNEITNLSSLIIKENKEYKEILKSWINPNKYIEAELLYRLTRDGEKVSKFHELCDNKGPTLTIFLTNDQKGENIGGIYTPLSWDKSSGCKNDSDNATFMFNLTKKQKYKKINGINSIWCTNDFGPWTINFGFRNTMRKINHFGLVIDHSYEKGSEILPNSSNDSSKAKFFDVIEVEVFKIIMK